MADVIVIDKRTGVLRAIYSDPLFDYLDRKRAEFGLPPGRINVTRATHVEPDPQHTEGCNWSVDLSPMGGPLVYSDDQDHPFITRESALAFEHEWLTKNWLCKKGRSKC